MLYLLPLIIITLDQISKKIAVDFLKNDASIKLIGDFLQLNYAENYGAAFSILYNKQLFLIIISSITIIGIILFMYFNKNTYIMNIALSFVIGGAIGNLIDRIRLNYVIDFIDVKFGDFYDFPVFNIADSFIVIGTLLMFFLVITDNYSRQ